MIEVLKTGLRKPPTGSGSILHRSLRAVNLEFGERVVTILNRSGLLTSSSIVLDTDKIPSITTGEFDGDILHTDSFDALLKNRIDLALITEGTASISAIREMLHKHMIPRERSIMGAILLAEGQMNPSSVQGFEKAVMEEQAKRIRKCRSVEDAARTLLGIGFGLTPSGDDFILGSVGLMQLTGRSTENLRPLISGYNNAFSRTMLLDGLDGYFPQPLLEVLQALDSGNNPDDKIVALERIGHTSGFDMVAGMYYTAANFLH
jgi:hypothetical protein